MVEAGYNFVILIRLIKKMLERVFVRIYQPIKSSTQSGFKKYDVWKIKFRNDLTKYTYNLMSWTGSRDTRQQLDLTFPSKEAAIAFVNKKNWSYEILETKTKKIVAKSYSHNFQ